MKSILVDDNVWEKLTKIKYKTKKKTISEVISDLIKHY